MFTITFAVHDDYYWELEPVVIVPCNGLHTFGCDQLCILRWNDLEGLMNGGAHPHGLFTCQSCQDKFERLWLDKPAPPPPETATGTNQEAV